MIEQFKAEFPGMFDECFDCSPPPGWVPLVRGLCLILQPFGVKVAQVKSKFGGLRFYVSGEYQPRLLNVQIDSLISWAEGMSFRVCERCGSTSNVESRGRWIRTLCEVCRNTAKTQESPK